jgi:hypothetical protein
MVFFLWIEVGVCWFKVTSVKNRFFTFDNRAFIYGQRSFIFWLENNLNVFPSIEFGVSGLRSRRPVKDFYTFAKTTFLLTDIFSYMKE